MHNIAFATSVAPTRIVDTCLGIAFRFAASEKNYLVGLENKLGRCAVMFFRCVSFPMMKFLMEEFKIDLFSLIC